MRAHIDLPAWAGLADTAPRRSSATEEVMARAAVCICRECELSISGTPVAVCRCFCTDCQSLNRLPFYHSAIFDANQVLSRFATPTPSSPAVASSKAAE